MSEGFRVVYRVRRSRVGRDEYVAHLRGCETCVPQADHARMLKRHLCKLGERLEAVYLQELREWESLPLTYEVTP